MKKKLLLLLIGIVGLLVLPVKAANYEIRELIPVNIETTIVTNVFSYRSFYFSGERTDQDYGNIVFKSIKNISDEERPISISIALFDENKKNIGTINYCSKDDSSAVAKTIKSKEEIGYSIEVTKDYLEDGKYVKDIKYISILSDNLNCRSTGSDEFYGQTVEEIGQPKNTGLSDSAKFTVKIMTVVVVILVILFLYKYLFTTAYQNVDGEDVRNGYRDLNDELRAEREKELRLHPPKPKEKPKVKTDEVLMQEEQAKNEDKTGTNLHNMYK